jgi:potassium channel subfamily K, other eukaryote
MRSDLEPHSHLGRIFTIIYAMSGVACLGIALGVLGNSVIEAQHKAAEKTKEVAEKQVISLFSSNDDDDDDDNDDDTQSGSDAVVVNNESKMKGDHPILLLAKEFAFVFIILIVFACLMADEPGVGDTGHWDIVNAIYYAVITSTTVGYGDFAPTSQQGRLIAMIYIPLAVGAMGKFCSIVAAVIMNAKQESFRREMQRKELTCDDLEIMDADGNGIVTRAEFIEFMLVAMNKVDKSLMDELRAHFNRLDADGTGSLSKEDLIHNARQRLKTSAKRMELKAYKQKLLAQSAEAAKLRQRGGGGGDEQQQRGGTGPRSGNSHRRASSFFQLARFDSNNSNIV